MPTPPVSTIVNRQLKPDVEKLLVDWSKHLDEIVNWGSNVLGWITQKPGLGGDEEAPLILTFRNSLELIDSISILFAKQSIDPCKLQLRALLESIFVISYIVENNSRRRALNYLVCYYHDRLSEYMRLDQNTPQGIQWQRELRSDKLAGEMRIPVIDDLEGKIANLDAILGKPEYADSEAEYQRLRRANRRRKPVWHEFFGGPRTIVDLARHLNLMALYNILYRFFSKAIHGQDIIDQRISKDKSGYALISQIRNPRHAQFLCTITITISFELFKQLIEYYIPERKNEFAKWYIREMRDFIRRMSTETLLTVN